MEFRTRKLVKPEDLNPRNTLFGGRLLAWIDEECAIYASCRLQTSSVVTKLMSEIDFVRPAYCGDVIEFGVATATVGRTSITLRCEVREKVSMERIITIDRIVFVALDARGRPVPHGLASCPTKSGDALDILPLSASRGLNGLAGAEAEAPRAESVAS